MADIEKLHFKIELGGTYWKKVPIYSILVNDKVYYTKEIASESGGFDTIEFDAELEEGPATLKIRLENKDWTDTVENEDKTAILQDMLLNIKRVEIDEIDLGNLIFTHTKFRSEEHTSELQSH